MELLLHASADGLAGVDGNLLENHGLPVNISGHVLEMMVNARSQLMNEAVKALDHEDQDQENRNDERNADVIDELVVDPVVVEEFSDLSAKILLSWFSVYNWRSYNGLWLN